MKATINHLTYNTETAELLASESYGYSSDFNHWCETLYKTKKGNYFLHGEGGAMSKYAKSCGSNSVCGGDAIVPLTETDALAWCEEHECQDTIDAHFSHLVLEA